MNGSGVPGAMRARRWQAMLWVLVQLLLPVAAFPAAAEDLGGIPTTAEEQYWAFYDSAAALHARGKNRVALQEVDEALRLRPGDADAVALRESILAALHPPASAPALAGAKRDEAARLTDSGPPAQQPTAQIPAVPSLVDRLGRTVVLRLPLPILLVQSPALDAWSRALDRLVERDLFGAEALLWQGLLKDPGNAALRRAAHLLDFVRRLGGSAPAPKTVAQIDLEQAALALVGGGGIPLGPDLERWRQLVLAYLQGRGFGTAVRLSEPQKVRPEAALLFGQVLGEACMRAAEAALVDRQVDDALLALQAAAVLAPRSADLRRWVATLDGRLQ